MGYCLYLYFIVAVGRDIIIWEHFLHLELLICSPCLSSNNLVSLVKGWSQSSPNTVLCVCTCLFLLWRVCLYTVHICRLRIFFTYCKNCFQTVEGPKLSCKPNSSPRRVNVFQFWLSQEIGCMPRTPVGNVWNVKRRSKNRLCHCSMTNPSSSGTTNGRSFLSAQADQLVESLQLSARSRGLGGTCEDRPRLWKGPGGSATMSEITGTSLKYVLQYELRHIKFTHARSNTINTRTGLWRLDSPKLIVAWVCNTVPYWLMMIVQADPFL